MSVISVKTILYQQVCALVQASAALYSTSDVSRVRPGNLIRVDTGKIENRKPATAPADYPQLIVAYGSRWRFTGDSGSARYGDQNVGKPVGRVKTLTVNFVLTLTHLDQQAKRDDLLELALVDALEASGPNLGISRSVLPFVQRGDIDADSPDYASVAITTQMKGIGRAESSFRFPVMARWTIDPSPTTNI